MPEVEPTKVPDLIALSPEDAQRLIAWGRACYHDEPYAWGDDDHALHKRVYVWLERHQ